FLNVFIWRLTSSLPTIVIYNLFLNGAALLAFTIGGYLSKRFSSGVVLRIGIACYIVFYVLVWLQVGSSSLFFYSIGMLYGVANGLYWLSYNTLTFEITEPETRTFFNAWQGMSHSMSGIVTPLLSGVVISRFANLQGYQFLFFVAFVLFIIGVVLSLWLPIRKEVYVPFQIKKVFAYQFKNESFLRLGLAQYFQGIREGSFFFVVSVLLFIATTDEFKVGVFSFVTSAGSFLTYSILRKRLKHSHRNVAMVIGGLFLYVGCFLLYFISFPTMIVYALFLAIGYPLFLIPFLGISYDLIGKLPNTKQLRVEYIALREFYLNAGRVCSVIVLYVLLRSVEQQTAVSIAIVLLGAGHLIAALIMKKVVVTQLPHNHD
ncbi:MAG: MFS transporter, partial [Bacilli bacterium]